MIKLKTLLEQDYMQPKAMASSGALVLTDPKTNTRYWYRLYVDTFVDMKIFISAVDLKNMEITYKHPVSDALITADLKQEDVAKITKQYKTTDVNDSIEGLTTKKGDDLYLMRIR